MTKRPRTEATPEPVWFGQLPDWSPAAAKLAYYEALGGNLRLAADLCDSVRSEARIRGLLQTRANALFACDIEFDPAGDKRKKKAIQKELVDGGEFWHIAPESALTQILVWGWLLNLGLGENVWAYDDELGKWRMRLVPKHPRNLRWDHNRRAWFLLTGDGRELEITPGDGQWVLFQPFGDATPWLHGLWWALAQLWLAKAFSEFSWDNRNQARGSAGLVGTSPASAEKVDLEAYARSINDLRRKLGIALPPGYDLKTVDFGASDYDTFSERVDRCDTNAAILLLGQNLTTEVKGASFAAEQGHEKVRQDYLDQDSESLSTCLRPQVLGEWTNVRYGARALAPWPKWKTEPPEDTGRAADTTNKASLALAQLLKSGVDVDIEAYCERYAIPIRSPNLKPLAPPPNPNKPPKAPPPAVPAGAGQTDG